MSITQPPGTMASAPVRFGIRAPALAISAVLHVAVIAAVGSAIREASFPDSPVRREPVVVQVQLASSLDSVDLSVHDGASRPPRVEPRRAAHVEPTRAPRVAPRHAQAPRRVHAAAPSAFPQLAIPTPAEPAAPTKPEGMEAAPPTALVAADPAQSAPPEAIGVAAAVPEAAASAPTPAEYLRAPEPDYPRAAREDEEEGLVVLRVRVSTDGLPTEIRLGRSSGFAVLDRAAIVAVRHWTFVAATDGRRPIESWMDIPIRFRLRIDG